MVIHNYDFTNILMIRFNNTMTQVVRENPKHNLVFHFGITPLEETQLLQGTERREGNTIHIDIPDVPTTGMVWTNTIKKQFMMMMQIAHSYQTDFMSVVLYGNARKEVAAIAINQLLRDMIGAMYLIEFCAQDEETENIYKRVINGIYRS